MSGTFLNNLDPVNQLFVLMGLIGIAFLMLVIFLDNNDNFALKRDWRKKNPPR